MPDPDEVVGVRIRQRPDQHGVNDAEDCGGRADAECEREYDGESKPGVVAQLAQAVPEVSAERVDHVLHSPSRAYTFTPCSRISVKARHPGARHVPVICARVLDRSGLHVGSVSGSEISVAENGRADEHCHRARDCLRGEVVRYAD
jgi:hypothetical protein